MVARRRIGHRLAFRDFARGFAAVLLALVAFVSVMYAVTVALKAMVG